MLLNIQGSMYNLYDPEIATSELLDGEGEIYFFSGNLSELAISNFLKEHWCSGYRARFALGSLLSSNANLGEDSEHAPCRYRGKNVYCPSL